MTYEELREANEKAHAELMQHYRELRERIMCKSLSYSDADKIRDAEQAISALVDYSDRLLGAWRSAERLREAVEGMMRRQIERLDTRRDEGAVIITRSKAAHSRPLPDMVHA